MAPGFKEGHDVDPDIEVKEDPAALAKGIDPQIAKAIEEVMNHPCPRCFVLLQQFYSLDSAY